MNRASVSDISHNDCTNHSILDARLVVYHTPRPPAVATLPLPPRHSCHPVLLVEALKHCLAFSLKQIALKSTFGFCFATATLLLKTIVRFLYFELFGFMSVATCSGSALHPDSSPASNLAFK